MLANANSLVLSPAEKDFFPLAFSRPCENADKRSDAYKGMSNYTISCQPNIQNLHWTGVSAFWNDASNYEGFTVWPVWCWRTTRGINCAQASWPRTAGSCQQLWLTVILWKLVRVFEDHPPFPIPGYWSRHFALQEKHSMCQNRFSLMWCACSQKNDFTTGLHQWFLIIYLMMCLI